MRCLTQLCVALLSLSVALPRPSPGQVLQQPDLTDLRSVAVGEKEDGAIAFVFDHAEEPRELIKCQELDLLEASCPLEAPCPRDGAHTRTRA